MAGEETKQGVRDEIRTLYKTEAWARALFDHFAQRKNNSRQIPTEQLARLLGESLSEATAYAKRLHDIGCGKYVVGRRGGTSRFEWLYSTISLGRVAAGQSDELVRLIDDEGDEAEGEAEVPAPLTLTIPQAKEALARTFGVTPDKIEIIVKA